MVPIAPPSASRSPARSAARACVAALLSVLAAPAADASPTSVVVLEAHNQSGAAFLEWSLVDTVSPPAIDSWVVTRVSNTGEAIDITLPATASSYLDVDVEAGHSYIYTVTYVEGGVRLPPSNPVLFSTDCFLIFQCNPVHVGIPPVKIDCLLPICWP